MALKHKAIVSCNLLCLVQENSVLHLYPLQIYVNTTEQSVERDWSWTHENTSTLIPTAQTLQQKKTNLSIQTQRSSKVVGDEQEEK